MKKNKKIKQFSLANTLYGIQKYREGFLIDTKLDKPFYDFGQNKWIKSLCKKFSIIFKSLEQ